jgi:hypothetical protein
VTAYDDGPDDGWLGDDTHSTSEDDLRDWAWEDAS